MDGDEELVHAADIEAVEQRILQLALERTGTTNGAIFLWDERDQALHADFHVVEGVEIPLSGVCIRRRDDGSPSGVAWHVREADQPYLTNDTSQDPYYADYFLDVGSIAAAPINYQHRAIGVLSVSSRHKDALRPEHLAELEALAASTAKFLRRAQLYRQSGEQGRRPILIKGLSPEWGRVEELIERVSPSDAPVLIRGESGTGKELVAHAIHFNSKRTGGPFVSVNCAAIPEQLLESELFGHEKGAFTGAAYAKVGEFQKAHGGTLFLDELGELSPVLQAKVLRAIELGEVHPLGSSATPLRVDARVLAATNRDLEAMRAEQRFRDDLYFRVAVVTIDVPPLRSYLHNLKVLCQVFVARANRSYGKDVAGITEPALERLRAYHFPGNMRELRNLVDHGVLVAEGRWIEPGHLPLPPTIPHESRSAATAAEQATPPAGRPTLAQLRQRWVAERERAYLPEVLRETGGDVTAAARLLGVDRTTLYRLLKRRGLRITRRYVGA
ncbi:MAG: sigma 54-interacting transcriptional regulator [Deltaproteobacteria bacterium]|jgi:transcriptional regulator with GAF, ATPase, and Fis domain|nr:sigma 54-interacting transcriptional regulator [Deltaproteobacteria bacterium]MBW2533999.1 sigma 54-interacting transcriptional regulator [Deltaproteobacteria bacterium]